MNRSRLYIGSVIHRRLSPRTHAFRYNAFWLFVDLDGLEDLSSRSRLFSYNKANIFCLYDRDHGDGSRIPLKTQIVRLVTARGLDLDDARIFLLCMPRMLGHCFNPLSVYFCCRGDGTLAATVYEVHNTFGERHSYILPVGDQAHPVRQSCEKRFFVSPFLDMDLRYEFRTALPDTKLAVAIRAVQSGRTVLFAAMSGAQRKLNDRALLARLVASPWISIKVMAAIHFEAIRLWTKGIRTRPHPAAMPTSGNHA